MEQSKEMRCRRSDGSFRAAFETKEQAEAFAADPRNWPVYQGDLAHLCRHCGFFHLSKPEWLSEADRAIGIVES